MEFIRIVEAREHNLKGVSIDIPKNKLVAFAGPSGSGKSSLAMGVLARESQRQFLEAAGKVTEALSKPEVAAIEGLLPAIGIGQTLFNRNPRSTVGTTTEIYTYLRILYAKLGHRPCPRCGATVAPPGLAAAARGVCPACGEAMPELTMAHFSYSRPEGFCEACSGLGAVPVIDLDRLFDGSKSIEDGAVYQWGKEGPFYSYYLDVLKNAGTHYGFTFRTDVPIDALSELERDLLLHGAESETFQRRVPGKKPPKSVGAGKFGGLLPPLRRKLAGEAAAEEPASSKKTQAAAVVRCPSCDGARLKAASRQVEVNGRSIDKVVRSTAREARAWVATIQDRLPASERQVLQSVLADIVKRLDGLADAGVGYLSLDRTVSSLSGGEAQRLRLASLLQSGLSGLLFILDEPTSGLHPSEVDALVQSLKRLRDRGNTVVAIEHDPDFLRQCDYLFDFGPSGGENGGAVVAQGTVEELRRSRSSVTGPYLTPPGPQRAASGREDPDRWLELRNVAERNLRNVTVELPLGRLVCVTGVSGSGKSTLLFDVLAPLAERALAAPAGRPSAEEATLAGLERIQGLVRVDQVPAGKSSRSTIATYTDVFAPIRNRFARLASAGGQRLRASDFSFNVDGGRCDACQGLGAVAVAMHFLPDVHVRCAACGGKRYTDKILRVTYEGFHISDVLDMPIDRCAELFRDEPDIRETLGMLRDFGLGYLRLGQPLATLSGGELQRVKLTAEIGARRGRGDVLYLLDEPTTGLHPSNIDAVAAVLQRLVDEGNSVMVIEHSVEFIRRCDWVVELGPGGGDAGGEIVAAGRPEQLRRDPRSRIGRYI
ncbi:MAG TPA: excinuclease ABC subunit UvrA [Paenibacillus sp.]|nr:excinuclease ABC subunit UvrA [Paenibacillus sp.]